jgi:hypothetical protein
MNRDSEAEQWARHMGEPLDDLRKGRGNSSPVADPAAYAAGDFVHEEVDVDEPDVADEPYLAPEDVEADRPESDWNAIADDWRRRARRKELRAVVRADLIDGSPAPEGFRSGAAPDETEAICLGINVDRMRRAVERWGTRARPFQVFERWCGICGVNRPMNVSVANCRRCITWRRKREEWPSEERVAKWRRTAGL